MFGIKFVSYPAYITYLSHLNLINTFIIFYIECRPIYQISEFSSSLIMVLALAAKIPYQSGPDTMKCATCFETTSYSVGLKTLLGSVAEGGVMLSLFA